MIAMAKCVSVVCRSVAKALDKLVQTLEKISGEPAQEKQRSEVQDERLGLIKQEPEELQQGSHSVEDDAVVGDERRVSARRLNVSGRF